MNRMEQARKAGASGLPFTLSVVVAIVTCIGLLIWSASSSNESTAPAATMQSR
jgi:hypothetical protein